MWYAIAGLLTVSLAWQQGAIDGATLIMIAIPNIIGCIVIIGFALSCERANRKTNSIGRI